MYNKIVEELQQVIEQANSLIDNNSIQKRTRILNASHLNGVIYGTLEAIKFYNLDEYCRLATESAFIRHKLSLISEEIYNI